MIASLGMKLFIIDPENVENVLKATFERMSCQSCHGNLCAKFEKLGGARRIFVQRFYEHHVAGEIILLYM